MSRIVYPKANIHLTYGVSANAFSVAVEDSPQKGDDPKLLTVKSKNSSWYTCREELAERLSKDTDLLLYNFVGRMDYGDKEYYPIPPINLISFFDKIENLPKLGIKTKTEFFVNNNTKKAKGLVLIKISPFWLAFSGRLSLFTALLRCAIVYNPLEDNFKEALWSTYYTSNTKVAIGLFLAGYNCIRHKNKYGWKDDYQHKRRKDLVDKLFFRYEDFQRRKEELNRKREEKLKAKNETV